MNIFIDTNILIDLYHLSGPDLDELKKIIKLIETGKISLYISEQVSDEFWRNREDNINSAFKEFKTTRVVSKIPNLVRTYPQTDELKKSIHEVEKTVKDITKSVEEDIKHNSLKADEIINELFSKVPPEKIERKIFHRTQKRQLIGNPPGKKSSAGDAIHWEWLLDNAPDEEDFIIISADGDFESTLIRGSVKEFLHREWNDKKNSEIFLFKSLPEFLRKHFPKIKLSDELEKLATIERLEMSSCFATTHSAIEKLTTFDDFSNKEVESILNAYRSNNQVFWILEDEDILKFAKKIISFAKDENTLGLAKEVEDLFPQDEQT